MGAQLKLSAAAVATLFIGFSRRHDLSFVPAVLASRANSSAAQSRQCCQRIVLLFGGIRKEMLCRGAANTDDGYWWVVAGTALDSDAKQAMPSLFSGIYKAEQFSATQNQWIVNPEVRIKITVEVYDVGRI